MLDIPNITLHRKAILYSWLSSAYDMLGDRERAIIYRARSAIADVESSTYETTSAKVLAHYMHEEGSLDLASKYISLAQEEADIYNSSFRKLEIQALMPHISKQMYDALSRERFMLIVVVVVIVTLLIAVVTMFVKIKRRNEKLRRAHKEIEQSWEQLTALNESLCESTRIKDLYIIQSLYGDSEFVDRVEAMCLQLSRKIKAKQYSDLDGVVSLMGIKQQRQRMSLAFDSAFLKLFPNFISEYNKLFSAEHAIELDQSGALSTELRIFALIRLGIEDVSKIASYLNISTNTIYVYKAKVKAKSLVPKDEFEERVKAIK